MAETIIFDIAVKIISKLAQVTIQEVASIWGVRSDLNKIKSTLSAIESVLADAAARKVTSQQVKDWLEKLQDVLYDIDDVLDDFMTEDLRRQVEVGDSKRKKVLYFFSSSNQLVFSATMRGEIKKLRERLEDIAADRRNYPFLEQLIGPQLHESREQSHSFVRASDVIGRGQDKEKILRLLSSPSQGNNLSVLPIVGFGGLGKTTLAKFVFNDQKIKFGARIWVCASESFDLEKIVGRIIAATGAGSCNLDLDQMQNWLQNYLKSKKFLLVLDDVWNEDPKKWMDLRDLLSCGVEGSCVIVTTRSRKIAETMGTLPPYNLKGLSNDECLLIFLKCAFKDGQGKEYPNLVEIGKAIIKKCGGVPLAVRSLGSLLCTTIEESEWTYIKDNEVWEIAQKENDILPILRLSYDRMPINLRRCFAYCALYPKDFPIIGDELICRWISQEYIQSDGHRQLEEIGRQYINNLISWSFFQDVEVCFDNQVLRFKMHDLVHDLAQSVALTEVSVASYGTKKAIDEKVRHVLFYEGSLTEKEFPSLLRLKKVRSIVFAFKVGTVSMRFLEALVKTFKYLRVMDLGGSESEGLPGSIGRLQHLRYLRLEGNHRIRALPESICDLLNLQTLYLDGCENLQELPGNFSKLRSLRYLFINSTAITCLAEEGLEGLQSLRCLSILGCPRLAYLSKEVPHLTALRELVIENCPNLSSFCFINLKSLEILRIDNCGKLNLTEGEGMEGLKSLKTLEIFNLPELEELPVGLQNATATLKYLNIRYCSSFKSLPVWLKDCACLLKFAVVDCKQLKSLPTGVHQLTTLRYLRLSGKPTLIEKCKDKSGGYLPWIRRIPKFDITTVCWSAEDYAYGTGFSSASRLSHFVFSTTDDVAPWAFPYYEHYL